MVRRGWRLGYLHFTGEKNVKLGKFLVCIFIITKYEALELNYPITISNLRSFRARMVNFENYTVQSAQSVKTGIRHLGFLRLDCATFVTLCKG